MSPSVDLLTSRLIDLAIGIERLTDGRVRGLSPQDRVLLSESASLLRTLAHALLLRVQLNDAAAAIDAIMPTLTKPN